jgi:sugar phosphate isomerase/epimerase
MNRRHALQTLSSIAIASAADRAFGLGSFSTQTGTNPNIQLGAQTNAWAIDPKNLDSFFSVLSQIKQVGYAGFETGFFNLINQFDSSQQAADRIAATGLTFFGIHIAIPFDKNDPATHLPPATLYERVARGGHALGAQRLIFSGAPSVTTDDVKRKVEALNTAGRYAKSVGLEFAYHNHWWEFQSKVNEIETLYADTDPAFVSFLLDAGHAYRGGADVPLFLRKHSQRIVALHLRDYRDGHLVPLGEGTFPLAEVAATLRQLRWKGWAINEEEREDATKGGLGYIEPAYQALQKAFAS